MKHRSLGLAILLLLLGVTIIAVSSVFAKPVTTSAVVQVPYGICVIQLGVQDPNGTVAWSPYYAYPGTPISQCQTWTTTGQDVLGRTIVIRQFILGSQSVTVTTSTTVTGTSTSALTSTSTAALASTSTTTLASTSTILASTSTTTLTTAEATPNSALAILIVAILAVAVFIKRAKTSGG